MKPCTERLHDLPARVFAAPMEKHDTDSGRASIETGRTLWDNLCTGFEHPRSAQHDREHQDNSGQMPP